MNAVDFTRRVLIDVFVVPLPPANPWRFSLPAPQVRVLYFHLDRVVGKWGWFVGVTHGFTTPAPSEPPAPRSWSEQNRRPLMLSYTIPEQQQHRRVRVCLEDSAWSTPFGLDEVWLCTKDTK